MAFKQWESDTQQEKPLVLSDYRAADRERGPMAWKETGWIKVGNREVILKRDEQGNVRASTTSLDDDPGAVFREPGVSGGVIPPAPAGSRIDIDPAPGETLKTALVSQGLFSQAEADRIVRWQSFSWLPKWAQLLLTRFI
jgi:hypothetical protein